MNCSLTEQQIHLLHHTLGLTPDRRKPYRNHFVASTGHHDMPSLEALEAAGLMKRVGTPSFLRGDDIVFCVTDAGRAVAIDNLPEAPKRTRYEQYLRTECCETFAEWLGIVEPEVQIRTQGGDVEYRYRRQRYVRLVVEVVEGDWKSTKKEAKASYKEALRSAKEKAA